MAIELLEKEKIGEIPSSEGVLELELIEYADEVGFSPFRVELLSRSIVSLHMNLSRALGIESDKVVFKYFDSGSGVRLGVECAKVIAETMSTLLTQWWDRIVYWRYEDFDKKMTALSKTTAFANTVHELVQKKALTEEVGENLKLRVFREVETLTGIGAIVPLSKGMTIDHQQLLTEVRNTKLLKDGSATDAGEESPEK